MLKTYNKLNQIHSLIGLRNQNLNYLSITKIKLSHKNKLYKHLEINNEDKINLNLNIALSYKVQYRRQINKLKN